MECVKMSNRKWGGDEVKIIKELRELITGRISLEDIFSTSNQTEISRLQRLPYQPNSNHPLRANLNPINSQFHYKTPSKQVRSLTRGKFYLTHGLPWSFWNSMQDFKYAGALDIIYILTKEEMKNMSTEYFVNEDEIITMTWPAYWLGRPFDHVSLQICPHIHVATGYTINSAMNESEFTKNFKQLIPIGDSKIIALNYPNL